MRFTIYITLLIILLAFSQCKKEHRYPDDTDKSKKTPNERLEGDWEISEYTLDGNNILDTLNKICGCNITEDIRLEYYNVREDNPYWELMIWGASMSYKSKNGFDDYHYLEIGPFGNHNRADVFNKLFITPFHYAPGAIARWDVTKLFGEELKVKMKTDTGEYKISFIRLHL